MTEYDSFPVPKEVDSSYAVELLKKGKPKLTKIFNTPDITKVDVLKDNLTVYHFKINAPFIKHSDNNTPSPIGISRDDMKKLCSFNNIKYTGKTTDIELMEAYKANFIERLKKNLPTSGIPTQSLCAYIINNDTPFFMSNIPVIELDFSQKKEFSLLEWGIIMSSMMKSTPTSPDVLYSWYINLFNAWVYSNSTISPFINNNAFEMEAYLYGLNSPPINQTTIRGSWEL